MTLASTLTRGISPLALAIGLLVAPGAAWAQAAPEPATADDGRLEEIVVTARKQEESLNSVPLAVSAFSERAIAARGIQNITDISNSTPGFKFQHQAGEASGRNDRSLNTLTFRGLRLSSDQGSRAGGLLFVDGAPIISGTAPGLSDIQRVEVLKGPQSAFFGRSTFSGAVNYVTKDPPKTFMGEVNGLYGSYDTHMEQLVVGGPLAGDKLRARISVYNDIQGGQYKNFAQPSERFGYRRTTSIGGQLLYDDDEGLRIKASVTAFENRDGPPPQAAIKQGQMNCQLNPNGNRYFCGDIPKINDLPASIISGNYVMDARVSAATWQNENNYLMFFDPGFLKKGGLKRRAIQGSFRVDYEFAGGYSLSSVTALSTEKTQVLLDLVFRDTRTTPNPLFNPASPQSQAIIRWYLAYQQEFHGFSQEVRLTSPQDQRFRWVLGGNYIQTKEYTGNVWGQTPLGSIFTAADNLFKPRTPAAFGAAYFDFTPQLTLAGEIRYQIDKVRQDALSSATGVILSPPVAFRKTYKSVSPRVTLSYKTPEGSLFYGLWSRGYRPGGFNTSLSPALGAGPQLLAAAAAGGYTLAYNQERLDNYEIGAKLRLLDGKLQFNADAYYDTYNKGQITQVVTFSPTPGTLNNLNLINNAGKIKLKGVEIEANLQATPQLLLSTTFAINDSEVKNGFCSDCQTIYGAPNNNNDLRGKRLPIAPKYTATFGAEYTQPVTDTINLFARTDVFYRGRQYIDQANIASIGDRTTLNLRIGARTDRLSAELFCTNCTQNRTMDSAVYGQTDLLSFTDLPVATRIRQEIRIGLPQKRIFGIRAGYKFGG